MITFEQFIELGKRMSQDPFMFQEAVKYKSEMQVDIIPLLTPREKADIVSSVKNQTVIDKLIKLAVRYYQEKEEDTTLCCLGLSIAAILVNYKWERSTSNELTYKLATKIYECYVFKNGL